MHYEVSKAVHLSEEDIHTILSCWNVPGWLQMSVADFRQRFFNSEFHLLREDGRVVSIARINADFLLEINNTLWRVAEFVGFAAVTQGKGYGSELLHAVIKTIQESGTVTIGFCEKELRPFYEKHGIPILYDAAKYILEKEDDNWVPSTDDDILILYATDEDMSLLNSLGKDNPGYIATPFVVA